MSDEQPVPEQLETIAARIGALSKSMDAQFAKVDAQFAKVDTQFAEMKSQLRTEIEAVRGDVRLVAEGLAVQTVLLQRDMKGHARLRKRVGDHDLRILALEPKNPA